MARKNKQARLETISGGYGAIPWTVLDSVSFKGASDKAKALLFALMRQHSGSNNGRLHLAKKWLYNQGWTCDENNRKARNELIERGLIVQTKWGGLNMGADLFALTWHEISNYVSLDISAKSYSRGAYTLCNLTPTPRRKPPMAKKKMLPNDRASASPTTEPVKQSTSTTTELVKPLLSTFTGTTTENNVFIPLHTVNSVKRIVGVKGKSGISKQSLQT
ncbi:MAG: hypothetical protein Q8J59_08710 [Methylotenera sp.]|nr:hypothetical protein [Methylotenera sp.]MDP2281755.1 hypothetical protein [Methylotenera sp.]MDP3059291.1 hypothetical protein [Methylotenera sp.]